MRRGSILKDRWVTRVGIGSDGAMRTSLLGPRVVIFENLNNKNK